MKKTFFHIAPDESDCLLTFGVLAVFFGILLIYPPAAYIIVGIFFIYLAFLQAKVEAAKATDYRSGSVL
jgi:uncharacterized membrane protein YuzA (DUF378 family)